MNRKDFLRSAGLAGLGFTLPFVKTPAITKAQRPPNACTLIPSETAGPFPLDLTENTAFFRQDVREDQTGVQLNIKIRILGLDNCLPMQNVRVNIWHCNRSGVYSGYNTNNNAGDVNAKWLRGYQFTDANGYAEFVTIFPGWYTGRIAHIHFQVHVSSNYSAVSQFTFDIPTKNAIYAANPTIYTKGADPMQFSSDNIFSDGYALQLATLTPNTATGGYDCYFEATVQGTGTSGVGHIEKETAKVFELGQNYPNPYRDLTTVPLTLHQTSDIRLELWDINGRLLTTVIEQAKMAPGNYQFDISPAALGLPAGNYMYQLEAKNDSGIFRMPKMMTVAR